MTDQSTDDDLYNTNNDFSISRAAIHEAAHAVVALRLGLKVTQLSIDASTDKAGHMIWWEYEESLAFKSALIGLAGGIAEKLTLGADISSFSRSDLEKVNELLAGLKSFFPSLSFKQVSLKLIPVCRKIIEDPFSCRLLFLVANELDRYKTLGSEDLQFLLERVEKEQNRPMEKIDITLTMEKQI